MLKKHGQLFENILFVLDLAIIACSWLLSYYIRFYSGLVPVDKGIPNPYYYLLILVPIVIIWPFAFRSFGLYRPKRISSHLSEVLDIAKASVFSVLILISLTFFFRHYEFSRSVFLLFAAFNIVFLSFERWTFREVLRYLRRKGYNLRYAIVVGTGDQARLLIKKLEKRPEVGIKIVGLITTDPHEEGRRIEGLSVLAHYDRIKDVINDRKVDHVFLALSWQEHAKVVEVLSAIGDEAVDIKVIPDVYEFMTLRGGVEDFDGIPILNLQNSPLYGWNMLLKRAADIVFSSLALVVFSPLFILIPLVLKLTSKGPVLYRQERMGIGGDTFEILKFRSMRVDAENETGAVWAQASDPRRTAFGAFLRKTSLDELPQFFNVLMGDMSLVGPRPERPVFIRDFRKHIPRYMLRHKMKAGITGWAQVNGWRGNTDLKKRIEHDLYYIENWSLGFDIKILFLTLWKGLVNRNAY